MSDDDLNKIETLVGEVQALYKALDFIQQNRFHWTPALIEEAEEWVSELKERANTEVVAS